MDLTKVPRKVWEHPDPKSTAMWAFMQDANRLHGLNLKVWTKFTGQVAILTYSSPSMTYTTGPALSAVTSMPNSGLHRNGSMRDPTHTLSMNQFPSLSFLHGSLAFALTSPRTSSGHKAMLRASAQLYIKRTTKLPSQKFARAIHL